MVRNPLTEDLNGNKTIKTTKNLKFNNTPTSAAHMQELEMVLRKHGGTLQGLINMNEHEITNLNKNPSLDYEAEPKN